MTLTKQRRRRYGVVGGVDFTSIRWEFATTNQGSDRIGLGCFGRTSYSPLVRLSSVAVSSPWRGPTDTAMAVMVHVSRTDAERPVHRQSAPRWRRTRAPRTDCTLSLPYSSHVNTDPAPKTPYGLIGESSAVMPRGRGSPAYTIVYIPYTVYLHFSFAAGAPGRPLRPPSASCNSSLVYQLAGHVL